MIAYVKCNCTSKDKLLIKRLQSEGYEIRDVRRNAVWRTEVQQYKTRLPFIVVDGTPIVL